MQLGAFEDSVLPILEAERAELVDDGYELGPELSLVTAARPYGRPDENAGGWRGRSPLLRGCDP